MSAPAVVDALVVCLAAALRAREATLATAESCTGGMVAAACTSLAGSSEWFERGVVTYSNAAKSELLDVPAPLIAAHGAVSAEVARAMAAGVLARSPARFAVAVTGIAGPGGGAADKPVGLVHFAAASRAGNLTHAEKRYGDIGRSLVRHKSVLQALAMLRKMAEGQ